MERFRLCHQDVEDDDMNRALMMIPYVSAVELHEISINKSWFEILVAYIIDNKIWIQHDGTERGVARDLERAGIPKDCIVLAFQYIHRRQYGDYAAA